MTTLAGSSRQPEATTQEDGATSSSRCNDTQSPRNRLNPNMTRDSVYLWMGHAPANTSDGNQNEPSHPRYVPPHARDGGSSTNEASRRSGEEEMGAYKSPCRGSLRAGSVPGLGEERRGLVDGAGGGERNAPGAERRPLVASLQLSSVPHQRRSKAVAIINPATHCPIAIPPQPAAATLSPSCVTASSSSVTAPSQPRQTPGSGPAIISSSRPAPAIISSPPLRAGPVSPTSILDSIPSSSETASLQPVLRPSPTTAATAQPRPIPVSLLVPSSPPAPRPVPIARANPVLSPAVAANQQPHLRLRPIVISVPCPSPAVSAPRQSSRPVLVLRPPQDVSAAPPPRPRPGIQIDDPLPLRGVTTRTSLPPRPSQAVRIVDPLLPPRPATQAEDPLPLGGVTSATSLPPRPNQAIRIIDPHSPRGAPSPIPPPRQAIQVEDPLPQRNITSTTPLPPRPRPAIQTADPPPPRGVTSTAPHPRRPSRAIPIITPPRDLAASPPPPPDRSHWLFPSTFPQAAPAAPRLLPRPFIPANAHPSPAAPTTTSQPPPHGSVAIANPPRLPPGVVTRHQPRPRAVRISHPPPPPAAPAPPQPAGSSSRNSTNSGPASPAPPAPPATAAARPVPPQPDAPAMSELPPSAGFTPTGLLRSVLYAFTGIGRPGTEPGLPFDTPAPLHSPTPPPPPVHDTEERRRMLEEAAALMELCMNPDIDQDEHERKQLVAIAREMLLQSMQPPDQPEGGDDVQGGAAAEEERQVQREGECVVCSDETPDAVLVPCGHLALCSGCCDAMRIKERGARGREVVRCPLCRTVVEYRIKVFKA